MQKYNNFNNSQVFSGCSNLTSISIPRSVQVLGGGDDDLEYNLEGAFYKSGLVSVTCSLDFFCSFCGKTKGTKQR